ncbi:hypothetical protein SDC9_179280 [bioreactor metagenome]|uniref:Uncharacterized protein n=1 Tax=bioreactor metagenome TaxID=1076179 RepID=A0A645GYB1_9ZZZZ
MCFQTAVIVFDFRKSVVRNERIPVFAHITAVLFLFYNTVFILFSYCVLLSKNVVNALTFRKHEKVFFLGNLATYLFYI